MMQNTPFLRIYGLLFASLLLFVPFHAQGWDYGLIAYDQEIQGTIDPADPKLIFSFYGLSQYDTSLTLDIETLATALTMTLYDADGNEIASNQSHNYPYFQGAYLFVDLARSGSYWVVVETPGLEQPVPFRFVVEKQVNDEPETFVRPNQPAVGNIANFEDQDIYLTTLQAGVPVLISVITPLNILDAGLWIFTPQAEVAAYATDFYSTAPLIPFVPAITGTYYLLVEGDTYDAAGPYTVTVQPIPELSQPPVQAEGAIQIPGDARAYSIRMDPQQVYELKITGEEGFDPAFILSDAEGIQAWNRAEMGAGETRIPGFTPLTDERHFIVWMGASVRDSGAVHLSVTPVPDEAADSPLFLGEDRVVTIGPIGDRDRYRFYVEQNQEYSFFFYRTFHGLDPQINIYTPEGALVWQNDNAVINDSALLSKIQFPQSGEYLLELLASTNQPNPAWLTGVGVIRWATGAPFDLAPPLVVPSEFTFTPDESGQNVTLNAQAIRDDTYPITGQLDIEPQGGQQEILLDPQSGAEIHFHLQPDEIAFIDLYDSADSRNFTRTTAIPGPVIVSTVSGTPAGLAIDEANRIYVTESVTGSVLHAIWDATPEIVVTGLETNGGIFGPNALAFDAQGQLYGANAKTGGVFKIFSSGSTEPYALDLAYPADILFDRDGVLYVAQLASDVIDRIHPDGTRMVFVEGIRNPSGMAFAPDGTLYVCNNVQGRSGIYRIEPDGTPLPFLEAFTETLDSIVFDVDGYLYAADGYLGVIYRIDPQGEWLVFARGLSGPVDLAFGQGEERKVLFASNLGTVPNQPYIARIIAMPTGRVGYTVFTPGIAEWALW
ncbi:MAG: SMP-30/gluconolactonase/LRE family protein [bacterium]|jgi:sugar lactone lactonase YvrE|nr:SMP-30/gluconolactonase/LRE family protein [bacterium]